MVTFHLMSSHWVMSLNLMVGRLNLRQLMRIRMMIRMMMRMRMMTVRDVKSARGMRSMKSLETDTNIRRGETG